ncbi:MAG: molybdopterin-guanine dinucleotide biosynthesis protein B [Sulfurovaceae bacterium]|nr:molybdopterin-guanine dinucleotide biosynthesis protein B [Sulfurovaceae bacterium]
MAIAVAFTGMSNSGKTTLIEKIAKILVPEYRVAIIKHDPKDKAVFDTLGKDSYKFSATGAEVVVASPTRTTYFSQKQKSFEEIVAMFGEIDLVLVEGLKTLPLPRICIARDEINMDYLGFCEAIAIDESIDASKLNLSKNIDILPLNEPTKVIEWIWKNAKEI